VWSLLSLIAFYLLINVLLLAAGVGIGYLLRWLLPAVDWGAGILIGVVTTAISAYVFGRVLTARVTEPEPEDETDEEPEAEDDSRVFIYPASPFPTRRRRKRKRR